MQELEEFRIVIEPDNILHSLVVNPRENSDENFRGISRENQEKIRERVAYHKADINAKNATGLTPLQLLINQPYWSPKDTLFLVQCGANPNTKDISGCSLLHLLACMGYGSRRPSSYFLISEAQSVLHELISKHRADINITNTESQTLLEFLLEQPEWKIKNWKCDLIFLVKYGANANTKDKQGNYLLHKLITNNEDGISEKNRKLIAKLITRYNADIHREDANRRTPLQLLINQTKWYIRDVMLLVKYGANPNTKFEDGSFLLHKLTACSGQGIDWKTKKAIAELITLFGADLNLVDTNDQTPLQLLINQPSWLSDDALFLVEQGADPNTQNEKGCPLLHLLVCREDGITKENIIAVTRLISRLRIDVKDIQNRTALQALMDQPKFNVSNVLLLLRHGANPKSENSNGESLMSLLANTTEKDVAEIMVELIVKHAVEIPQEIILNEKCLYKVATQLFNAWLDPKFDQEKDNITAILLTLRAELKGHHLETVKANAITLEYISISLLAFDFEVQNQQDSVQQFIENMATLANENPDSFLELFTEEMELLIKKNPEKIVLREAYLRGLFTHLSMRSFQHYKICLHAVNQAFEASKLDKIDPLYLNVSSQINTLKENFNSGWKMIGKIIPRGRWGGDIFTAAPSHQHLQEENDVVEDLGPIRLRN